MLYVSRPDVNLGRLLVSEEYKKTFLDEEGRNRMKRNAYKLHVGAGLSVLLEL